MKSIKLSILIPSLYERSSISHKLINNLLEQIGEKPVELLTFSDNVKRSIGEKRNNMLDLANGEYIVFVDDDDMVSSDFVDEILKAIENNNVDVINYKVLYSYNDNNHKEVLYSKENSHGEDSSYYYRRPNHLMVHKKDNIKERFKPVKFGEDDEWASRQVNFIKSEYNINKILYFYNYNSNIKRHYN
jgi:glycosyltransferase involved in cell wall biosynthesis